VILWNYQTDAVRNFRENQLQVIEIEPFRLRDYPALVRRLGALTDKNEKAEALCAAYQKKLSSLPKPETMRNVYFELYGPFKSIGAESYAGDLLAMAGGRVMNQKTGLVSAENLLAHKPEIIFYMEGHGSAEEIRNRPGFSHFPAVRNNRIHAVPRRMITEGIAPLEAVEFFRNQIVKE
jgi:ABC-type Fe3+-hydroxamate transport system substrate-binding protein